MKGSDFPRKIFIYQKLFFFTKSVGLLPLGKRLCCVGMRSGTHQESVCLSAWLLLQGGR